MRLVKKYANRKLYDTGGKRYVTMEDLALIVKSGEEIRVVDNETGRDLTVGIVKQLLVREEPEREISPSFLMQVLRKGPTSLFDHGRKFVSVWRDALFMHGSEIDRFVNRLVREKELTENEAVRFRDELAGHARDVRKWIKQSIDNRVGEILSMINPASGDHLLELAARLEAMERRLDRLEEAVTRIGPSGMDDMES